MSDAKADTTLDDCDNLIDNNSSDDSHSSADHVERHLLGLESDDSEVENLAQLADQDFSENELSGVINIKRLQSLLQQSDEFLGYLAGEVDDFDDFH